ncbi:MAG TPA: ATP-binding cassette domain-containing protein, partial [Candidatus Limnocylindria bacterium]|nr:ATP-binding cassette domain-containing protein [Candidatus Limnocylindria bacterium]
MALLEISQVSKRFGGLQALAGVSLELDEGVIASLIGPNGAGKTTLFNTLTGLYRPDEGEIRFQNHSLVGLKPEKIAGAGISRTFQNIRLFSHMTVLDNVLVGRHARLNTSLAEILLSSKGFHTQENDARRKALELIELTGLSGRENEWAQHLSYGDQRRLEIARALAT